MDLKSKERSLSANEATTTSPYSSSVSELIVSFIVFLKKTEGSDVLKRDDHGPALTAQLLQSRLLPFKSPRL